MRKDDRELEKKVALLLVGMVLFFAVLIVAVRWHVGHPKEIPWGATVDAEVIETLDEIKVLMKERPERIVESAAHNSVCVYGGYGKRFCYEATHKIEDLDSGRKWICGLFLPCARVTFVYVRPPPD